MKTAVVSGHSDQMIFDLDRCLGEEGFAVDVTVSHEQLINALTEQAADAVFLETRRDAFVSLLKAVIRLSPEATIYLIETGSVFCRYPMRGRHPDIVTALHKAGIRISDRLFTMPTAAIPVQQPPPKPSASDAFLV
jgi:hypothetical protein